MEPSRTEPLDLAPLATQPSSTEVSAFRTAKNADPSWTGTSPIGAYVAAVLVPVVAAVALTPLFGAFRRDPSIDVTSSASITVVVIMALSIAVAVAGVTLWARSRWTKWLRIDTFARANGMTFRPSGGSPSYSGMIFGVGSSRNIGEHLTSGGDRFFDYGTYRYTTGSGKSRQTHTWGYLAFKLDRRVPQMVLDARANDRILASNLPAAFNKDQRLSLEGDFDRYFTLYCPSEYERDALYVFTPDLMALLIDEVSAFDVEVVDDWMFVYSTIPFAVEDPAVHQRMHQIMQTVGAKTVRQTQRYADDRVPDSRVSNIVAPEGRRLRRSVPVGAIIVGVIAVVIFVALQMVGR